MSPDRVVQNFRNYFDANHKRELYSSIAIKTDCARLLKNLATQSAFSKYLFLSTSVFRFTFCALKLNKRLLVHFKNQHRILINIIFY